MIRSWAAASSSATAVERKDSAGRGRARTLMGAKGDVEEGETEPEDFVEKIFKWVCSSIALS